MNYTTIGSDNGLLPGQCQAIIIQFKWDQNYHNQAREAHWCLNKKVTI